MSINIKKVLSLFAVFLFSLIASLNIFPSKVYALGSCPESASFHPDKFAVANGPAARGVFILVGNSLNNITRILLSWGDGKTDTVTTFEQYDNFRRAVIFHTFTQVGDFKPYFVLGDSSNWYYICSSNIIESYNRQNLGQIKLSDPLGLNASSVIYNTNTMFGGDNIIGLLNLYHAYSEGVGGNTTSDTAKLTISRGSETFANNFGTDTNISDDNPNFEYAKQYWSPYNIQIGTASLDKRPSFMTLSIKKPAGVWINNVKTALASSVNFTSEDAGGNNTNYLLWRPRTVSQPPTPTPPSGVSPTAAVSQSPQVSGWTFPSRVFDQANNQPVTDIVLKLYGSNDGVNKIGPLATCSKANWDSEKCRPTLFTTSFYKWYFVKKEANPTGFSSVKASCASPAIVYPTTNYNCQVIDANTVKWGGKYGYHEGTKGFYSWSDFVVKKQ